MRRSRQQLTSAECADILSHTTCGVLAVGGDCGYPYGVPLNHWWNGHELVFHCARAGHKIDALGRDSRVSYTVIDQDRVVEPRFTTAYRSVIVFGRVHLVADEAEKRSLLRGLAHSLCPTQGEAEIEAEIDGAIERTAVLVLTPEHISGKQGRELLKAARQ